MSARKRGFAAAVLVCSSIVVSVTWLGAARARALSPAQLGVLAQQYYRNPLRRIRNLYAKRIDEGVDYSGSGPIKALGLAQITVIDRGNSIFWGNVDGNVVIEKMEEGPLKGLSIYSAENCTPNPNLTVGEQVTATTTLCQLHNAFPYIEIGFARRNRSGIPAAWSVYRNYPDGSKTIFGRDFSHLLRDLGAPPGNSNNGPGDMSYNPSVVIGTLPKWCPRF